MKSFRVIGPESSGTRLATKIFIQNGVYGDDGHVQRLDSPGAIRGVEALPFVIRRSLPHGGRWPDLGGLYRLMVDRLASDNAGKPGVVITVREPLALARSQVRNRHVKDITAAQHNILRAYLAIMRFVLSAHPGFYILPYEALVLHAREAQSALLRWAGVPSQNPVYTYDGDVKYYEEAS